MHCGQLWLTFTEFRICSKCPIFSVSKIASVGPNHLTADEVLQSVCYSSRFTLRICDFSRCFISKIVVGVGEVRRSSSFCKHATPTSMRRVPYSVSHIIAQRQYAQLGYNSMVGQLYYNYCSIYKWCNLRNCSVVYLLMFRPRLAGVPIFFPRSRIIGTQCTYINQSEMGDNIT